MATTEEQLRPIERRKREKEVRKERRKEGRKGAAGVKY